MKSLIVFVLILATSLTGLAQRLSPRRIPASKADVVQLTNQLIEAIDPIRPENSYMTPLMKEKIQWVYDAVAARKAATGQDMVRLILDQRHDLGQTMMQSLYYQDGLPYIEIVADRLILIIRYRDKTPIGFTQKHKNTFALGLIHEAVHLERPKSFFVTPQSKAAGIAEEFRTWDKVDRLAVGPLLKIGQPLEDDFIFMNGVLAKCGHKLPCQPFADYITNGGR
jgi:hypothetical protein